jgi:hypothetical protein
MPFLSNESLRASILAVTAFAALTGVAAAQVTAAQQSAIKANCTSDFMSRCSGVTPGGKDALVCLQTNVATLSPGCRSAIRATMPAAAPAAAAAKTPTVVAAPAAAGPTPQQLSAVKHTCSRDFKRHCRGVTPGGQEALVCLQRNAARLTPDCKISLADIAQSTTIADVPAPAAAPARHLPPGITPAGRILRRVMERSQ